MGGTSAFRGSFGDWMTEETQVGSVEFTSPVSNVDVEGEQKIDMAFGDAWGLEYKPVTQSLTKLSDEVKRIVSIFSAEFPDSAN